jgi:radical SAM superfamily enzyme YgiQ (UPF0313 family)
MPNQSLASRVSRELLPFVQQPAQYIGGEHNQLPKPGDWADAEIRVAVAFPDTYAIGMSHLGCQILYWLCNHTPGVCAERVYAPWSDAEQVMREQQIPLFTWDTRQEVATADIFAISLQYELCFTTVLNLLDLAGIPLRAADRARRPAKVVQSSAPFGGKEACNSQSGALHHLEHGDFDSEWPLVIVGGPQADNPEPMAEFVDLVVIGDGEHALAEILEAVREYKRASVARSDMILLLARRFPWIYAPNLYDVTYHADGTIAGMLPKHEGLPARIERCKTPDFDAVPFPTRQLVPWTPVVHDRIAIEIMRGCPQVCRFCHAGYTKRPLTLRSVDRILEIAEVAYAATGQHEIGLLSLSTADYPYLKELAARFNERFGPRHVNMSFPSLRIDKMLQNIPWMASTVRKGSITMAVEAAKDDMRAAIRKKVTDGNLLDGVREVYKAGWNRVKLYFMSGFPGERDEDIYGIWETANAVSQERQRIGKPAADVNASVGWLVPKPFTPLQWMAQPRLEYFLAVREKLRGMSRPGRGGGPAIVDGGMGGYGSAAAMAAENNEGHDGSAGPAPNPKSKFQNPKFSAGRWNGKKSAVKITMHDPRRSILEGVMSRGDRRLGAVIYEAWRRGARLDGWDECYRDDIWQAAFAATGIDPAWYAHRERSFDEILPWDHIGLHMRRGYLEESYESMFETIHAQKPTPGVSRALPVMGGA